MSAAIIMGIVAAKKRQEIAARKAAQKAEAPSPPVIMPQMPSQPFTPAWPQQIASPLGATSWFA